MEKGRCAKCNKEEEYAYFPSEEIEIWLCRKCFYQYDSIVDEKIDKLKQYGKRKIDRLGRS